MKFKPIKNRVAFVRIKSKLETDSGIIIQSDASQGADQGRVFAVGPDVQEIKENDQIIPDWTKVKVSVIDNNPIYILAEENVNAIIEGE